MLSPNQVTDYTNDDAMQLACESGDVATLTMMPMASTGAQDFVSVEAVATIADSLCHGAVAAMTNAPGDALVNVPDVAKENEDFLSETEFALLSHVTTIVGDYDPLSSENIEARNKFIPVLEARGGIDKDEEGHRRDTIPIAHEIVNLSIKSAVFQFLEENSGLSTHAVMSNEALKKYLKRAAHGVIVRNNPGTISAESQKNFDQMLRELSTYGITILNHPDVAIRLGAKDSLVKIKKLKCGLEDTEAYYTPQSFRDGFRKSIAFQPRVIKQNRGSQGEGIWICKLMEEKYCDFYGERIVSLDAKLELMEAFDNHVEYHTVGEFIDFCINGRTFGGPEWSTTSNGKYFEGGLAAGAMVVDQRFLPRIVEGEVRCLMIGTELVEIVHKVPKEGGLSATLQSGAVYTKYLPSHPKFAKLVRNFKDDLPHIMECFSMADHPLPLLWTADYIYGATDDDLHVGEINCTCVGITQQLHHAVTVAKVAVHNIFENER